MSPHRRIARALVISVCVHVLLLAALEGKLGGESGPLKLPGILLVDLINLSAKGAEASVAPDQVTPFRLQSSREPDDRSDEVAPALSTELHAGEVPTPDRETGEDRAVMSSDDDRLVPSDHSGPEPTSPGVSPETTTPPRPAPDRTDGDEPGAAETAARCASCPKPGYPPLAQSRGIEGTVVVRFQVMADGRVGDIFVEKSSGFPVLDEAAMSAVKTWTYFPATRDGQAVSSSLTERFRFGLSAP